MNTIKYYTGFIVAFKLLLFFIILLFSFPFPYFFIVSFFIVSLGFFRFHAFRANRNYFCFRSMIRRCVCMLELFGLEKENTDTKRHVPYIGTRRCPFN